MSEEAQINIDGFESDEDLEEQQLEAPQKMQSIQIKNKTEEVYYALPPGQGIASKKYSLNPDISTGWQPRKSRSHPIPISVDFPYFDSLYERITKKSPNKMRVCYYGPRYDNTYFAWNQMPFEFPYTHIEPPEDMKFTNRPFYGQHPALRSLVVFDSFFEGGNLDCAIQTDQFEYDLYLRVDSNTRGHFLWYNFKVSNLHPNVSYKFNICNLQRDVSLYSRGMKPFVLSSKAKQKIGRTWAQQGDNIRFEKRNSKSLAYYDPKSNYYCQLSFQLSTNYEEDTLQIAYSVPYGYTDMRCYLDKWRKKNQKLRFYREEKLCLSLGGLPIPLVSINEEHSEEERNIDQKKCVIIACRVHPAESNSSFLLEGFIDFLCSNKKHAKHLRSKTIFKIVPMLNPDGVCFGNSRTGLSGKDFNREYQNPDPQLFPEVYCMKKLVTECKKRFGQQFWMFLDIHGHSVKKNVFMYGPEYNIMDSYYYESRILPRMLSKRTPMFRYYSCVFKIEEAKKTTARAIFNKLFDIPMCFTIEASNGSYYDTELLKDIPFTQDLWILMGNQVCVGMSEYLSVMQAAQIARQQKIKLVQQRRARLHNKSREETNIRTSKLVERKKEKKKEKGSPLRTRQYQVNDGDDNDVDDLLKYIYEEIEQAESHKKQLRQQLSSGGAHMAQSGFGAEDLNEDGDSDQDSDRNDLDSKELSMLYMSIKRKKTTNERGLRNLSTGDKSLSNPNSSQIGNKAPHRRVFSAIGSKQEQYCKKLSQPKKTNKVNIDFSAIESPLDERSYQFKNKLLFREKRQPKTFQEFVTSCKNWEKTNKKNTIEIVLTKTLTKDLSNNGDEDSSPSKFGETIGRHKMKIYEHVSKRRLFNKNYSAGYSPTRYGKD